MWLVKRNQYDKLRDRESRTWYDKEIKLGQKDGMPIYTLTHSVRYSPDVAPSEGYWKTMEEGLAEMVSKDVYREYISRLRKKLKH